MQGRFLAPWQGTKGPGRESMPFSVEDFFAVFAAYNAAIWPLRIVAWVGGLVVDVMLLRPSRTADAFIFLICSARGVTRGIGQRLTLFAAVDPAAGWFAALFVLQAVLRVAAPFLLRNDVVSGETVPGPTWVAGALILFALALYPLIGVFFGHRDTAGPVFGVAPCPTAIFTIGVLPIGDRKRMRWLLILPAVRSAAILLSVPQDCGFIAAGPVVVGVALALAGHRRRRGKPHV